MSYYSKLKSHPNKRLEEHLLNVAENCENFCKNLSIKDKNLYTQISFFIGLSHDFAKSTSFFQKYLLDGVKSKYRYHGFLSAVFGYYVIKNYLKQNNIQNNDLPALTYMVINKHHGNLGNASGTSGEWNKVSQNNASFGAKQIQNIKENILKDNGYDLKQFYSTYNIDLEDFIKEYESLIKEISYALDDLSFSKNIDNYFTIIFLYSLLIDADKIDASQTELFKRPYIPSNIVDDYKKIKFSSNNEGINGIREKAYQEVNSKVSQIDLNNHIYSISLPTGSGKTLNAFNFAVKLKERINNEKNINPRIIYSLPFLSIIDQNDKVIREILEKQNLTNTNALLKHNYLSDMNYKVEETKNLNLNNARILIEGWNSEIIITTFIQFFYSLISNKNRSLRKFHNMVNSIIILDEIQAVPYKYWNILNTCLKKLAYEFNCWIVLMTATQPLIFKEEEHEIIPLIENKTEYYDTFNRINYEFNLEKTPFDDFKNQIIKEIENNPQKDIMIVLNTVNSSKELYEHLKEYFEEEYENLELNPDNGTLIIDKDTFLVYLSTNIIPKHRLSKINDLKKRDKRKIIVTTQLIEAGVDISVDIIYRDLAPIDSIIQTAGRCNRNNTKEKGLVKIVSLINEKGRKYSSMIYDSILLSNTEDLLKNIYTCSENEFNLLTSNKYNELLIKHGSQDNKLLKTLNILNFKEISETFKLIDETYEKRDVFVNLNNESNNLWDKFKEMQKMGNNFKRKEEFLKIKSEFYNYVISVNLEKFGSAQVCNDWLGYLTQNDINRKYDIETGFKFEDEEDVLMF
jgi:CRISPR-associated endonuclease/helicase Cas3